MCQFPSPPPLPSLSFSILSVHTSSTCVTAHLHSVARKSQLLFQLLLHWTATALLCCVRFVFVPRIVRMTANDSEAAQEPTQKKVAAVSGQTIKYAVVGLGILLLVGAMWRAVYVTNQRDLFARREADRKRVFHDALRDTPARRFTTTEGGAEGVRKAQVTERF